MRFVRVSEAAYASFIHSQDRVLFPQLPGAIAVRRGEGFRVDLVGVVEGNKNSTGDDRERLVAAAAVLYQPWKRVFLRAKVIYGPVLDYSRPELVSFFFKELTSFLRADKKVLSLRVNPPLIRNFYDDVTPGEETPEAVQLDEAIANAGGTRYLKEFYEDNDVQVHYSYVKDLDGMNLQQAMKSTAQAMRTGFNRWGTPGLTVEYLTPETFDEFIKVYDSTTARTGAHDVSESSYNYYREMQEVAPESVIIPAAYLDCDAYLKGVADERAEITVKMDDLHKREVDLAAEGKQLSKKQANARKEMADRLAVLDKREAETREVQAKAGNKVLLAASYFVVSPNELLYLLSGAYEEYQSYFGVYLIHRAMFEYAIENDLRWYNTFGISGIFTPEAFDAGVLHFKRQFKGNVEEYVGTYDFALRGPMSRVLGSVG